MKRMVMAGALLAACLAGCGQSDEKGMGPAQQAGKAIDEVGAKAADKVHEQLGKADAAAAEARAKAPEAVERARRNLDKVTDKVGEKVEEAGKKMREEAK